METSQNNSEQRIIVAFHTGRGGQFYNGGHKKFIGEKTFQDLITMNDQHLFTQNRDEKGRFTKLYITDQNGTTIVAAEDFASETGVLDFDGQYDTDAAVYIDDCDDEEIRMIAESNEYKSIDLIMWLENYNQDWKFSKYGALVAD